MWHAPNPSTSTEHLTARPLRASPLDLASCKDGKQMVKGICWDIPAFIVGYYGLYVYVQCFFPTCDVLCGGVSGSDLPLTFTVDVWIEWG